MGDPQGILGGSSAFSGDPSFWDVQVCRVYDVCGGDPAGALAPCIILRACNKKRRSRRAYGFQKRLGLSKTFLKLYHADFTP